MNNLWEKALANLKVEVNEQILSAWFLPVQQVSVDENGIVLGVPNKFFENWLTEKYLSLIRAAIQQVAGKPLNIQFQVVEYNHDVTLVSPAAPLSEKDTSSQDVSGRDDAPVPWLKSVFSGTRTLPESRYRELGFNSNYTFDSFVVGASNRFAHAATLAVSERLAKVYNPLFLYGGVGLGKTHLMQALGQEVLRKYPRIKVLYITSEEFTNQLINAIRTKTTQKFRTMYRNVDVLLIDDIQFIAGKESTQEEFFHTFNALHDAHKQIVLCSDRSPREIPSLEERLVSRFAWGLIADVQPPDFETRIAIIEKKSEASAIKVPKEILYFLAENIKTNIRELEGALMRVVAYSKLTGEPMSVVLAKDVLKGMIKDVEKKVTIAIIQKIVAEYFSINKDEMTTKKRTRAIAYPRQIAMYLSRELTEYSLPNIGSFFGNRDHTTVLHACDKITKELALGGETKAIIEKLLSSLKK